LKKHPGAPEEVSWCTVCRSIAPYAEVYHDVSKTEFFFCALALYQLQRREDAPLEGLKPFIKEEARLWK